MLVKSYFNTYKLPVLITRCSNNYGPYQFPEKLIPLMINNALQGKPLPVYGDGLNVRDWLYVKDHAKAIDAVTQKGRVGEVYNVGGHNEKTNIDIVKIIIGTLRQLLPGSDPRREHITEGLISYVQDRKGHDFRYAIDPAKITRETGWKPETMFDDGIVLAVRWYLDNPEWLANVTSGAYERYYEKVYGA
jgi:dTDP-glucose 4,6-dehydratase